MDGKDLVTLFKERGFVIKNASVFTKEADNVNLNELVERLTDLERKISSSSNIIDFAKNILGKIRDLEKTLNNDDYLSLSGSSLIATFNNDIKAMRSRFAGVQSYLKAEENMQIQKQNMFEEMRKLYELDKNKDLDDYTRTSEILNYHNRKKKCEEEYNNAYQFFIEQKKAYEDSIKDFKLENFKNELLKIVNDMQRDCQDLALSPAGKEQVQLIIADIRNDIAYYGLESIRSKVEFEELCKRFSIERVNKEEKVSVKEIKPVDDINEIEISHQEYPKPEKEEQEQISLKDRINEVYDKLKELNPDVAFKLVDNPLDAKFDGRIEATAPLDSLKLPSGFYYMNNGISNKFSNAKEPVTIEIGDLKRETKIEKEEPKKEEKINLFDKAKEAINRLTQTGRVEANKKYEVKKSRTAIIGSYPKSLLTFSALGAICGGITAAPVVATTAIGAGLGAIATKLYRKVTKGTNVKVEEVEDLQSPVHPTPIFERLHKAGDALMNIYKKRKSGEIKAEEKNNSLENLDNLEDEIKFTLQDYQDKQEEILLDAPSMGGR